MIFLEARFSSRYSFRFCYFPVSAPHLKNFFGSTEFPSIFQGAFEANAIFFTFSTFNYSVPFLSYLAIFLLVAACVLLYFIPIRVLILGWGINKFTRKLLRPHSIPNNELFDFLSRVPDDEKLVSSKMIDFDIYLCVFFFTDPIPWTSSW